MKMNKFRLIIGLFVLCQSGLVHAQDKLRDGSVSGSNLPHQDAILELESNNKGLLYPRVALDSTALPNPMSNHVTGMVVYNTANTADVEPGFYCNNGSSWYKFVTTLDENNLSNALQQIEDLGLLNFDHTDVINGYYTTTGTFENNGNYRTTGLIEIREDELIYATAASLLPAPAIAPIAYFDGNKDIIQFSYSVGNNALIYPPAGTKYIALSQHHSYNPPLRLQRFGSKGKYYEDLQNISSNTANSTASTFYDIGYNFRRKQNTVNAANYGIIFAGQSNMLGSISSSQLATFGLPTTSTTAQVYSTASNSFNTFNVSTGNWGVWWPLTVKLESTLPVPVRAYLKAQGATSLWNMSHWNPASNNLGSLGNVLADNLKEIIENNPTINFRCMVWIQGEHDANNPYNLQYYQNLKNWIAFVRGVVEKPDLKIVLVGMHKHQIYYNQIVRDAQVKVANEDDNVYFINPDSMTWSHIGDNIHYSGQYNVDLADIIYNLIKDF